MALCSVEPRTRKCTKGYEFLSFTWNLSDKCEEEILNPATKTGVDAVKTGSKKLVHKRAEATGELKGNEMAEKIAKPKRLI